MAISFPVQKLRPCSEIPSGTTPVVIAACGSFNPIHTGHLAMFEEARAALESRESGFGDLPNAALTVVGGFMSPVNDAYGKAGLAPFSHRLRLCELSVGGNSWISVDPWEGLQPENQRSYTVLSHILKEVKSFYADQGPEGQVIAQELQIIFLCGADLFESFYKPGVWRLALLERIFAEMLIVAICREGSRDPREAMATAAPLTHKDEPGVRLDMSQFQGRVGIVRALAGKCASSTLVRQLIAEGKPVDESLVPAACLPFLHLTYPSAQQTTSTAGQ